MKRLLLPILFAIALIAGCATQAPPQPDKLLAAQRDIKSASGIATTVILLNESEQDRKALATKVNAIANTIRGTIDAGVLSPAKAREFAMDAILSSGIKNKESAAYLVTAIVELIDDRVHIDFSELLDKTSTLRALLHSAANGVIDATRLYLN